MYVHRRCAETSEEVLELDFERPEFGYCAICGVQGTIYRVLGTEDVFKFKKGGTTYIQREDVVSVVGGKGREALFSPTAHSPATDDISTTAVVIDEAENDIPYIPEGVSGVPNDDEEEASEADVEEAPVGPVPAPSPAEAGEDDVGAEIKGLLFRLTSLQRQLDEMKKKREGAEEEHKE